MSMLIYIETIYIIQKTHFYRTCKSTLCVIALVNYEGEADARVVEPSQMTILTQTLNRFKGNKFTFFKAPLSDATLQQKFKLNEPTVFIYNSKKLRIAQASAFDSASIQSLLDNALAGEIKYVSL